MYFVMKKKTFGNCSVFLYFHFKYWNGMLHIVYTVRIVGIDFQKIHIFYLANLIVGIWPRPILTNTDVILTCKIKSEVTID